MHAVAGLTLATVFQLAHVVEQVEFPSADGAGLRYSWAEHQLRTTADFGPKSRLLAFLVGGLNRQVEHHLFARVCHVHYPALAPIVREVALAHGLPYHENATFLAALASHFRTLKRFGRPAPE
jgi:linoleoyl-CoA desaturase